jgi:cyclic beta-1,2-glucan synthetase
LTITNYNELVLGVQRTTSAPYVITEIDQAGGAIFAHNPFNNEFAERVAFAPRVKNFQRHLRSQRIYRPQRHARRPAALRARILAGRDGAGLDPCAALQTTIELAPHEGREIIFLLGEAESKEEAHSVVAKFVQPDRMSTTRLRSA